VARFSRTRPATNPNDAVPTAKRTLPTPTTITLTTAQDATPTSGVDVGRYGNTITLASVITSPARPAAVPAATQDTGGGGLNVPTQSTAPVAASPTVVAASAPTLPADLLPNIRPMTLAAITGSPNSSTQAEAASQQATQSASSSDTSPPDLNLNISGYGVHPGDVNPPPIVLQGSPWSGMPRLQGNSAAQYSIIDYTWTFPDGALKGYGTYKPNISGDVFNPVAWLTFAGDPTTAQNTPVSAQGFTPDDLNHNMTPGVNDPDWVDKFYFGPQCIGNQIVTCTATALQNGTSNTVQVADSVTLNAVRPTGSISLNPNGLEITRGDPITGKRTPVYPPFGETGVSPYVKAESPSSQRLQRLQFDGNYTNYMTLPTPVGIAWQASINPTATFTMNNVPTTTGVAGQFGVIQTLTTTDTRTPVTGPTQTGSLLPDCSNPGTLLDERVGVLYGGTATVGQDGAGKPLIKEDFDNPATPLENAYTQYTRTDKFIMTLMFQPSGGILVPIGTYSTWGWNGTANKTGNNNTTWEYVPGGQTPGNYAESTTFPTWSHTAGEVSNNWC